MCSDILGENENMIYDNYCGWRQHVYNDIYLTGIYLFPTSLSTFG